MSPVRHCLPTGRQEGPPCPSSYTAYVMHLAPPGMLTAAARIFAGSGKSALPGLLELSAVA